jgi:peroxiredoxin
MILRAILLAIFGTAFLITGITGPNELNIGGKAPDFSLADVDGKMISPNSFEDAKGYIVVFTCNDCPYAKAYQDRIAELHNDLAPKGFPVIAINTSDSKESIAARSKEKNYPFSYLHDETQETTKAYGATKTPHAFVLDKNKTVVYIGAIDNNYKDADGADQKYVRDAVEALLSNSEVKITKTKAIGCTIKWKDA